MDISISACDTGFSNFTVPKFLCEIILGVPRSTADMLLKVSTLLKICPEATQSILDSMDIIAMKFLEHAQEIKKATEKSDVIQHYRQLEVNLIYYH